MLDRERYDALAAAGGDMAENADMDTDVPKLASLCLEMGCKTVLIKCGTKGIYYRTSDREGISKIGSRLKIDKDEWADRCGLQACFKADIVRSTTGAGDTSIAAFLAGVLKGRNPADCVTLACAQGACCVTAYDALSGLKSYDELEKMI
jgi:sugar/nucleoside kinase (ribokinase family)